jgi:peptide methionine sulfoxide reductase msrA/msrB
MKPLTEQEAAVIIRKGTERPFSGALLNNKKTGIYSCRQCGQDLYHSSAKFDSGCGWPSFDEEIAGAVRRVTDADGQRTEITCSSCGGHLGHVFTGEGFTQKNTRHCVNSISMVFRSTEEKAEPEKPAKTATAVFAAGCFWGVEHLMKNTAGVLATRVGYTGGTMPNPDYHSVCTGKTGHYEALEIVFDPGVTSFADLTRLFFEIHDFSQEDGQGPDIGDQYLSAIFYADEQQKKEAEEIVLTLTNKGHRVATRLIRQSTFWPAEDYHQNYYEKTGKKPYCHLRRRIF